MKVWELFADGRITVLLVTDEVPLQLESQLRSQEARRQLCLCGLISGAASQLDSISSLL